MHNDYLDDFIPIDSAFLDDDTYDFNRYDDEEYDEDGYVIECP